MGTPGRPRAAEAGRAPRQAGIGAGRAASLRGFVGHPASPPPKFPGGAAHALPSQARGVEATRGRELFPRATGPFSSQTPRLHCARLGFPTWEAPQACARAPSSPPPPPPPTWEQAPGRARAETRAQPADPAPGPPLRPCRRRPLARCALARGPAKRGPAGRREVGPTRRCPRQRQVWELH